jgi:hypothetical protein
VLFLTEPDATRPAPRFVWAELIQDATETPYQLCWARVRGRPASGCLLASEVRSVDAETEDALTISTLDGRRVTLSSFSASSPKQVWLSALADILPPGLVQ